MKMISDIKLRLFVLSKITQYSLIIKAVICSEMGNYRQVTVTDHIDCPELLADRLDMLPVDFAILQIHIAGGWGDATGYPIYDRDYSSENRAGRRIYNNTGRCVTRLVVRDLDGKEIMTREMKLSNGFDLFESADWSPFDWQAYWITEHIPLVKRIHTALGLDVQVPRQQGFDVINRQAKRVPLKECVESILSQSDIELDSPILDNIRRYGIDALRGYKKQENDDFCSRILDIHASQQLRNLNYAMNYATMLETEYSNRKKDM